MIDNELFQDYRINRPLEDGVILQRGKVTLEGETTSFLATNVPHFAVWSSQTGYEWGYPGSGPTDLALNIIEWWLNTQAYKGDRETVYSGKCFKLAKQLAPHFVQSFLANAPKQGTIIPFESIRQWLEVQVSRAN